MNEIDVALICKALGDSNRLKIVKILSDGEKCACMLLEEFNITQPTLSHHMKILTQAGLIKTIKNGKWSYYSLSKSVMDDFKGFFTKIEVKIAKDCKCED